MRRLKDESGRGSRTILALANLRWARQPKPSLNISIYNQLWWSPNRLLARLTMRLSFSLHSWQLALKFRLNVNKADSCKSLWNEGQCLRVWRLWNDHIYLFIDSESSMGTTQNRNDQLHCEKVRMRFIKDDSKVIPKESQCRTNDSPRPFLQRSSPSVYSRVFVGCFGKEFNWLSRGGSAAHFVFDGVILNIGLANWHSLKQSGWGISMVIYTSTKRAPAECEQSCCAEEFDERLKSWKRLKWRTSWFEWRFKSFKI